MSLMRLDSRKKEFRWSGEWNPEFRKLIVKFTEIGMLRKEK